MSDPVNRAHIFGTAVWDFLADTHAGLSPDKENLRAAANSFLFDEDARKSGLPFVREANMLAHAVLAFLAADGTPEAFRSLGRASRRFESFSSA